MNEKLLEQKAVEYILNHFCKKVDEEYMIKECEQGSRVRCIEFEERKQMLVEFATEETKLLSECSHCVYSDSPCILADYGKKDNGCCSHYKNVFDEYKKLKEEKLLERKGGRAHGVWVLLEPEYKGS